MDSVEFGEALAAFDDLIARVERGEVITITRDLRPVAELRPVEKDDKTDRRPWGVYKGQFTVPDNFDDPLPEDLLDLFDGKG